MPSNFFDKFPSVTELLDSPPLKQLVDRASRNVVMTNVKTFVGRMASDLQTRAAEMKVPSVGELAERIAEWIAKQRASGPLAEINATGVLLSEEFTLPLAEEALQRVAITQRDYVGQGRGGGQNIADLLRQLTGAEAALVTNSHSGALLLALASLAGEKPIVVARGEVGEVEPGVPLPQVVKSAGVILRECGTVERASIDDYTEALANSGGLLTVASTRYAIAGSHAPVSLGDLSALARRVGVSWVADLGLGGLVDPSRYGLSGILQASAIVAAGADLVLVSGDRLLGGPACGIVLGRQAALEKLRKHALCASLAAPPLVLLALAATLELHQDMETAERTIPLLSLLAASVENLHSRAQRLAPQLAATPLVKKAEVVNATATLLGRELVGQQLPTWQIVIEPEGLSAADLAHKLKNLPVPVVAAVRGERLVLDLRTVFARQDMLLVDAFDALVPKAADSAERGSQTTSQQQVAD